MAFHYDITAVKDFEKIENSEQGQALLQALTIRMLACGVHELKNEKDAKELFGRSEIVCRLNRDTDNMKYSDIKRMIGMKVCGPQFIKPMTRNKFATSITKNELESVFARIDDLIVKRENPTELKVIPEDEPTPPSAA